MPREFSRSERVADAVQRELAELIRQEIRDPRLALVNITGVDVSRDLAVAKIHVNFIARPEGPEHADRTIAQDIATLNKASGFLRTHLAQRLRLRITPRLTFVYDDTGDRGQHLAALIDYAVAQNRKPATDTEDD